ncbi:MAG TPA: PepSY domain-containing protein [Burkholderiaceae bacterium]|nr:PepSY domain-containing protein [Burkholderiaceae bacterium]
MTLLDSTARCAPRGRPWQRAALIGAVALGLALTAAWAGGGHDHDHDHDHDRARAAVQAGEILPLPTLLEQLQRTHPGQVLALELDREDDGRWIYEIKLLRADGRLVKLDVDARTAQVLQVKTKGRRGGAGASSASAPGQ